ncbi:MULTISPECIES: antibiotic biosynthesis monooxygenase [Pseudomonas]|uniref:Antibiotic biosynthesis monooxygenase domain protein n=1 Tax=Pseudomonas fluorescens (strain Q2-87) TaxID=1038922 RepID=J2MMG2_PSEFQ|nr:MULTISPECIES: antibiotic biosynthesis monooxygenase [Pseudomonas]EJL02057.1 antibiotic biosynthesis monooxygenase domain protein [Pseudomonas fluorescens Q2-87]
MLISAINTVEIDAAPGRVGEVCSTLPHIVRALLETSECMGYAITDNRRAKNSWIVSGYWESESQMRAHFDHPKLAGFMDMLRVGMASRIKFNSFVINSAEDQCVISHG